MEAINRLKAVLADTGKTNKWLAEQLGKDPVTVSKWCITRCQARCDIMSLDYSEDTAIRKSAANIQIISDSSK